MDLRPIRGENKIENFLYDFSHAAASQSKLGFNFQKLLF